MQNDFNRIAKRAYTDKTFDYFISIVADAFVAFLASLFFLFRSKVEPKTFIALIGIATCFVVHVGYLTYRLVKCRKNYKAQKYTYHHVEIENIRGVGGHSNGIVAEFTYNKKKYSCSINTHKHKYVHVFDCGPDIIYTIDEENILT